MLRISGWIRHLVLVGVLLSLVGYGVDDVHMRAASLTVRAPGGSVWLVAPGATVTTSDLSAAEGTSPQAMVDHDLSSLYWTGRAMQSGDYIQVDLGDVYPANGVALFMGSHSGPNARPYDYLYNGRILVSRDGVSWSKVGADMRGLSDFVTTFPEQEIRYIRVEATADQVYWVQVRELLVSVPASAAPSTRPAAIRIEQAKQLLEEAREQLTRAEQGFLSVDFSGVQSLLSQAAQFLHDAEAAYHTGDDSSAVQLAGDVVELADLASLRAFEARDVEVRAAWVDRGILVAGPDSILETLDRLEELGINLIYPEVISKGAAAYPSAVYPRDPEFLTWPGDVMAFLVDAAHERGMQVHPWVWVLCAGYYHQFGPVMRLHPEWTELSLDGGVFAPNEFGTAWLNPTLPEVRAFLIEAFVELVTRYEVDGIHFDYIRYNEEGYRPFGYSQASLEAFTKVTGLDARNLRTYGEQVTWDRWRENNVTQVLQELSRRLRQDRPDLHISAAVVANPADALRETHQNWSRWLNEGLLDHVALMNYTDSMTLFTTRNEQAVAAVARGAVLPGIGIWTTTPQGVVDQVAAVQDLGAPGVVFFAASTLKGETARRLQEGPFRVEAISPLAEPWLALEREAARLHTDVLAWLDLGALPESASGLMPVLERIALAAQLGGRPKADDASGGEEASEDEFRPDSLRSLYTELLAGAREIASTSEAEAGERLREGQAGRRLMQRATTLGYLLRIAESTM